MTTLSLNEVQALSQKAARGAGMDWGLAEEAGRAARLLAGATLPGPALLTGLLQRNDGMGYGDLCPVPDADGAWAATGGTLCPITAGAALCDRAADWAAGAELRLGPVAYPALMLPHMVWAADATNAPLALSWAGVRLTRKGGQTFALSDSPDALICDTTDWVTLSLATDAPGNPLGTATCATIKDSTKEALGAFAHRTFAPETEERRLAGAGAGLTDND